MADRRLSDTFKEAATASDGKQYFVPEDYYPWAVFYRKSVFEKNGYAPPATFDEFDPLMKKMQSDGLVPFAFADKDGWPAMGTFDILNMRINGFDFHMSLMAGEEDWDCAEVKQVFDTWRGLLPYHQAGPAGRTWQEAATSMGKDEGGMYLLGHLRRRRDPRPRGRPRLLHLPRARLLDRRRRARRPDRRLLPGRAAATTRTGGKEMMKFLGTAEAADAANDDTDAVHRRQRRTPTPASTPTLQKKSAEVVGPADQTSPSSSTATPARTSPRR